MRIPVLCSLLTILPLAGAAEAAGAVDAKALAWARARGLVR